MSLLFFAHISAVLLGRNFSGPFYTFNLRFCGAVR